MPEKPIHFSSHVLDQAILRGTNEEEMIDAIRNGEVTPAKRGRLGFRKNFPFSALWKEHYYETKQLLVIVAEETDFLVAVTVFVFYFGGPE